MKRQCSFIKSDGNRCMGYAVNESVYCFFHVANGAGARLAGSRGGRRSRAAATVPRGYRNAVDVRCVEDVISLLEGCINDVQKGELDSRVANSVGYLANILIRALEQDELRERIREMQRRYYPEIGQEAASWGGENGGTGEP